MADLRLTHIPVAKAELLVRKPVAEVFEAFVNPTLTRNFWFTHGSGRLEVGNQIQWDWEMYGVSTQINVKKLERDQLILVEWGGSEGKTSLEFTFTPRADNTTFVSVTESGFNGDGDKVTELAMDSAAGFMLVLAGLKAYIEHGIELNLISDRFPDLLVKHRGQTT